MKRWRDVEAMIFEPAIDRRTEEKMLRGTLSPEDAPPEFARVAVLMRAASALRTGAVPGSQVTEIDRARQERMVASMAAIISASGVAAAGTHAAGEAAKPLEGSQPFRGSVLHLAHMEASRQASSAVPASFS